MRWWLQLFWMLFAAPVFGYAPAPRGTDTLAAAEARNADSWSRLNPDVTRSEARLASRFTRPALGFPIPYEYNCADGFRHREPCPAAPGPRLVASNQSPGLHRAEWLTPQHRPADTIVAIYDQEGNLSLPATASHPSISALYQYGPFGELLRATGPMAKANPFRFSTKYQDDETDLVYYGYRYYSASQGRWISRDPIEEKGGKNIYAFPGNRPVSVVDIDGRTPLPLQPGSASRSAVYPPANPISPPRLKKYDCSCCGADEVADGLKELTRRFLLAAQWLENHEVLRDPENQQFHSGRASCYEANSSILQVMNRTPRCWVCFMDRRWASWTHFGGDENFIHCFSMGTIHKEAVFDWFVGGPDSGQVFRGGVYDGSALQDFWKLFPYQASFPTEDPNNTQWVDCSQKDPEWKFDPSPLQLWVPTSPVLQ